MYSARATPTEKPRKKTSTVVNRTNHVSWLSFFIVYAFCLISFQLIYHHLTHTKLALKRTSAPQSKHKRSFQVLCLFPAFAGTLAVPGCVVPSL
jgi:hypothetical protein